MIMVGQPTPYNVFMYSDYSKSPQGEMWHRLEIVKFADDVEIKRRMLYVSHSLYRDSEFNTLLGNQHFITNQLFNLKNYTMIRGYEKVIKLKF